MLSPQQAVPVVQKERPPVFSPQIWNPLVNKDNLQTKNSLAKTTREREEEEKERFIILGAKIHLQAEDG